MQGAESLWGAEGGKCFPPLRSPSRRTPSKARGTPPTTPLAYAGSWNPDACRFPAPLFQAFAVSWWRDALRWRGGPCASAPSRLQAAPGPRIPRLKPRVRVASGVEALAGDAATTMGVPPDRRLIRLRSCCKIWERSGATGRRRDGADGGQSKETPGRAGRACGVQPYRLPVGLGRRPRGSGEGRRPGADRLHARCTPTASNPDSSRDPHHPRRLAYLAVPGRSRDDRGTTVPVLRGLLRRKRHSNRAHGDRLHRAIWVRRCGGSTQHGVDVDSRGLGKALHARPRRRSQLLGAYGIHALPFRVKGIRGSNTGPVRGGSTSCLWPRRYFSRGLS